MKRAVLLICLFASSLFPACGNHELFMDANSSLSNRRIDSFYEGDSAVQTREARRRIEETGFGYSPGMFQQ
ncbi:MAG: hypothetical protein FWD61_04520 [Phycisphaerales bacterium]|nr:hypothetical protein [Phycisphaerales bacterium]